MKKTSWMWICVLVFGLAACAGQPAEEPEPTAEEESTAITTEDFESGEVENVIDTTEPEEPDTPDTPTVPEDDG
jgi:hypothetical protein